MIRVVFALPFEGVGFPERAGGFVKTVLNVCGSDAAIEFGKQLDESDPSPAGVVLAGLAGGLNPALGVGAIVVHGAGGGERHAGSVFTVDAIVDTVFRKAELWKSSAADCVDLETAGMAALCAERGIPFLSIRSVSDTAADDLPVPGAVLFHPVKRKPCLRGMFFYLLWHPHRLPGFFRMVRHARLARARLHGFLLDFLASGRMPGVEAR